MLSKVRLSLLRPSVNAPGARQRTLKAIKAYQEGQIKLERACADRGISVPLIIC